MIDLREICVSAHATVGDVIERVERGQRGLALIVDGNERLLDTVTDGDLRRAFYHRIALSEVISDVLPRVKPGGSGAPISASVDSTASELRDLFEAHVVRHIPLLDDDGRVVDLAIRDDPDVSVGGVHAVIMAGGRGSRLRPLTDELPKPMLTVGGKPLLERLVEHVRDAGIRKVHITTNFQPDKIQNHFGDGSPFGLEVSYVSEFQPLGTAGSLRQLKERRETFLVVNGDVLTKVNVRSMIDYHNDHKSGVTIGVVAHDVPVPFGVIETDGEYVSGISEKPVYSYFVNAGIYIIGPGILDMIPEDVPFDMTELIELLIAKGVRVVPFPIREYWLDVGRAEDLETAQRDVISGRYQQ